MAVSKRLTSFDEFAMESNLRPEETAGFKAWLKSRKALSKSCAADEEWAELHRQYLNRELRV